MVMFAKGKGGGETLGEESVAWVAMGEVLASSVDGIN
jgi:hypothetical protein